MSRLPFVRDCLGNKVVAGDRLSPNKNPRQAPAAVVKVILGPDHVILDDAFGSVNELKLFSATSWVRSDENDIKT